jgi:hypothetical protein
LLLSLASVASKIIPPGVIIPVGIVTTPVGIPIFVILIFRRGGQLLTGSTSDGLEILQGSAGYGRVKVIRELSLPGSRARHADCPRRSQCRWQIDAAARLGGAWPSVRHDPAWRA